MELKFNPNLDYQNDAIASVVNLFAGQQISYGNFTIYDPKYTHKKTVFGGETQNYARQVKHSADGTEEIPEGVANKLELDNEELTENLKKVQADSRLKPFNGLLKTNDYNFAVEMETGTGKTYVYLKTIFELSKNYGFKKFIILVPSVAIKEGVLASIRSMRSHFRYHYPNCLFNDFQYSSGRLSELMNFARSDQIEIMVMTVQSLDSDNKVLNSKSQKHLETTGGVRPIDIINRTNPIVIIDEPQSTAGSQSRKEHIKQLNPLCTLQYSATHKKEKNVHKVYRLTSVDAYIKKLVKQIEVASVVAKDDHNYAYVKLLGIKASRTKLVATLEMDIRDPKTGQIVRSNKVKANVHDSLYDLSGRREMYENMRLDRISYSDFKKSVEIGGREIVLDGCINAFDEDVIKRAQIRKTIEEHFEKEKRLNPKGIKVLSLFFIDKVENYRSWDKDEIINGKFYKWFEEEYEAVRKRYQGNTDIKAINTPVDKVHEAYFAEDNKHHYKNTKGESEADIEAYKSILEEKEKLLSFENPIRFIFSHSALREGWDNPNVFQICTLNENAKSNDRKRQEIGRGLRLCVNQDGERIYGFETNTLTVMANQSYEDFAKQLQTEIENDEAFKFGAVAPLSFSTITLIDGENESITEEQSRQMYDFCREKGYIDIEGNITEELKAAVSERKIEIPEELKEYQYEINEYFTKVCGKPNIKQKGEPQILKINKDISERCPAFRELWNRIKDKTKYHVEYETPALVNDCAYKLKNELSIEGVELGYRKATIKRDSTGIDTVQTDEYYEYIATRNQYLPDIISYLQNSTSLTRKTIVDILTKSETLYMFYINPQKYMSDASAIINSILIKVVLEGIKYTKIAGEEYYLQEVFPEEEKQIFLDAYIKSDKSVYNYNQCDSDIEKDFARALHDDNRVVVFTKLPTKKFIVPTPLGDYTPDWAIVLNENGDNKLYFVVETKGSIDKSDLRNKEVMKILCGEKRFEHVGGVGYILAKDLTTFKQKTALAKDENGKTYVPN